ncbi:hypothetical protein V7S43_005517 [Phytophthora oleae]|uniref:RxLR effector protein n=1 Tax=Phytophthora oleae TaxID=2107226 RepID=A0ABD3FR16_9STRA
MRFAFLLLVAAVSLISSGDAVSTQADVKSRLLRTHKKTDAYSTEEEERGLDKSVIKKLPEQFKNMYKYPENLKNTLASWHSGLQSVDDAVMYMKSLNMDFDAIDHFVTEYRKYITIHGLPY